jgi:hypothetical protein
MRTITVTQTYELIVSIETQVPDDYKYEDMENSFIDFPIRVDVNPVWEDTENVKVVGVCVDALVSLTGEDAFALYEMKDDEYTRLEESEESDDE